MTDRSRSLTAGEKKLARHIFQDALNYENIRVVRIRRGHYAMTPFGSMYFDAADYSADFAPNHINPPPAAQADDAHWFVHEMVHVWQHYVGMRVVVLGGKARRLARKQLRAQGRKLWKMPLGDRRDLVDDEVYDNYNLNGGTKDLLEFTIEQQGDIIADYYRWMLWSTQPPAPHPPLAEYNRVLRRFLQDPKYPRQAGAKFRRIRNARVRARGLER